MSKITVRLPDELVALLDCVTAELRCTRAEVLRQAIEYYLADFEDLNLAMQALRDPADALLDWDAVKHDLLNHH